MNNEKFRKAYYTILSILVLLFFTTDCDLKNDEYKNIKMITDPSSNLVLVNKQNKLLSSYIPDDLVTLNIKYANTDKKLRKEAAVSFELLSADALLLGYRIVAVSAYRDYDYQKKLYNYYVTEKGLEYADNCSARPGHSEHQTGLAVDVEGSNHDYDNFEKTNEFEWMSNNAHNYGFIMRYPKEKEKITGFKYEPWHYRFVGVDVATYIYENNLTLEEYLEKIKD